MYLDVVEQSSILKVITSDFTVSKCGYV